MALPRRKGSSRGQLRGLMGNVVWRPIGKLKEFPGNPRRLVLIVTAEGTRSGCSFCMHSAIGGLARARTNGWANAR
jgi:hypothetical protein